MTRCFDHFELSLRFGKNVPHQTTCQLRDAQDQPYCETLSHTQTVKPRVFSSITKGGFSANLRAASLTTTSSASPSHDGKGGRYASVSHASSTIRRHPPLRTIVTIHEGTMALVIRLSMAPLISDEPNLCSTSSSLRMVFYSRHVVLLPPGKSVPIVIFSQRRYS
jgi:hypothetical protein